MALPSEPTRSGILSTPGGQDDRGGEQEREPGGVLAGKPAEHARHHGYPGPRRVAALLAHLPGSTPFCSRPPWRSSCWLAHPPSKLPTTCTVCSNSPALSGDSPRSFSAAAPRSSIRAPTGAGHMWVIDGPVETWAAEFQQMGLSGLHP